MFFGRSQQFKTISYATELVRSQKLDKSGQCCFKIWESRRDISSVSVSTIFPTKSKMSCRIVEAKRNCFRQKQIVVHRLATIIVARKISLACVLILVLTCRQNTKGSQCSLPAQFFLRTSSLLLANPLLSHWHPSQNSLQRGTASTPKIIRI